jgi:hypothetical protein
MEKLSSLLTCVALATTPTMLTAQTTGAIEGTVHDPSGGGVPGATVRIVEIETSAERALGTDGRGRYLTPGLTPGTYRIEVSKTNFRTGIRDGLELTAGRTVRADFRLQLGEAHESIVVVAETPLVSPNAGDWGGSIERQALESLPLNGRDLFDLSSQEPAAIVPATALKTMTNGLGIHVSVNGSRPNQNSFRLDGIYTNDATAAAPTSAAGRLLGLEGIQELRLVTSPFSAEYGRAAGAVFTAVSRSGSNDWHGSLYEFLRNSALDARNFFDPADEKTPPLRKNQFGGSFGGPVRRDRVFFFGNYEGIRETSSITERPVSLTVDARQGRLPDPSGIRVAPVAPQVKPYLDLYPVPNGRDFGDGTAEFVVESVTPIREDYLAGKVDVIFSNQLRSSARYTFDDAEASSPDAFQIWRFISDSRYQFVHTETQWLQSPNSIHSFRAGFSRVRNTETSSLPSSIPASLSFVPGQPLGAVLVVGLTDLGGLNARLRPRQYVLNDFPVNYDMTHIRGGHTIRVGAGYDRIQYNQRADLNAGGWYRFLSVADFLQARPRGGDLMAPGSDSIRGWRQNQFFAYVQDEFRASPRFGVTIGVRYEAYSTPTEVNGKIATLRDPLRDSDVTVGGPLFENPSKENFAPRAAIAWDPLGSGKTVLRAGAGIFFDLLGTRELVVAGARIPPFFNRLSPNNPSFPNLLEAASQLAPRRSLDGLDFYPNQPYVAQFQFSLQQQFASDTVAEIGYAGARGIHLPGQMGNINSTRPETLPDGRLFFPADAPRVNPAFEQIGTRLMEFNSFYHGLHAGVQRKWRKGFGLQAKYSWAKSIDETSSAIFAGFLNTDGLPTIFDYRQNRGLSTLDIRHSFAANFSYQLPQLAGGTLGKVLGGWQIHGLVQAQTGHSFAPRVGFDQARLRPASADLGQRPDFAAAPGIKVILGDPQKYFDPSAFSLPPAGFYGNLGRNTLTGPGLAALDLAVQKILWQTERHSFRLRLEGFNVTNHPNFQIPSGLALFNSRLQRLGSAGRITSTSTPSRQMQIAAKWVF